MTDAPDSREGMTEGWTCCFWIFCAVVMFIWALASGGFQ